MAKRLFIILLLLLSNNAWTQNNKRDIPSIDVFYGFKFLNNDLFNAKYTYKSNTFNQFSIQQPLQFVGAGLTVLGDSTMVKGKYFIGNVQLAMYIPQKYQYSDSAIATLRGYNVGMTFFGIDLCAKSKNVDLIFNIGFDAGRVLLQDAQIFQRNLFFSPKISFQPKFKLGPIALSLFVEYGYDLTKNKWQRTWFGPKHQNNLTPPNTKIGALSGLTTFFSIGYVIPPKK